jgi:large subunit ribosomal protein L25
MAESVELVVQARPTQGSHQSRKLRRQGLVPGVVYGHKKDAVSITLPRIEIEKAIRHGTRVIDLKKDGTVEKAFVRAVQWDHIGNSLLHVDFSRIDADERVIVQVPIEIRGTAPGINAGGVLQQPIHALSIECLAISVPDSIRVNVSELQVGGVIHVRDLTLPPGSKPVTDPEQIVVHVVTAQVEEEVGTVPEAGAVEPEVIGRKAAEDEETEE